MWHVFVDCCDVGFISTQLPPGQEWRSPEGSAQALDIISSMLELEGPLRDQLYFIGEGGFPGGAVIKESACNAGDVGLIPGSEKIPLEEEMVTHSSILAWKTVWTEEPGGLQFMGLPRVRCDWVCRQAHTNRCGNSSGEITGLRYFSENFWIQSQHFLLKKLRLQENGYGFQVGLG